MQAPKVWDLWEVDALPLTELGKMLGKESLNEEHQARIELMTQLQEKGLFTWDLELEFERLIEAYNLVYYDQERKPYRLHEYTLPWRTCLLLEQARDKRVSLKRYLEEITCREIISLCLQMPNSVLVNLILTALTKRIVLGNIDYEEALKSMTTLSEVTRSLLDSCSLPGQPTSPGTNRLAAFFKHLWSAEIQYRGGKAGSLQEIFARAKGLNAENICINYSKLKCYGTFEELQEYGAHYELSGAFIDLYEAYRVRGKSQLQICISYLVQLGITIKNVILETDKQSIISFQQANVAEFCTLLAGYTDGSFVAKLTNPTYRNFFSACYSQV